MVITQTWAALRCGASHEGRAVIASVMLGLLAACGGGSESAAPVDPPALTRTDLAVGDYHVYESTQTTTVPTGVSPRSFREIDTYYEVSPAGSRRTQTYSDVLAAYQTFDVNAALVSIDDAAGGAADCTYTPALQSSPPYPRYVGQKWSVTSTSSCGITATQSGEIKGRETLSLPVGDVDAYRAERQAITTSASNVSSQTLVCWYSVAQGSVVRCDFSNTSTPVGGTTPTLVSSVTQVLAATGGPGRAAVGDVLRRFQGSWRVFYRGDQTGSCAALTVNGSGSISGTCFTTGIGSVAVTGSVNAAGVVTLAWAGGGTLVGNLNTPYAGSGTWAEGSLSGSWTASHN